MSKSEMIISIDNINILILIDKLFTHLNKTQAKFNETNHFINESIVLSSLSTEDIYNWLKVNQNEPKNVFLLGIFSYFNIISLKDNNNEGFNYFLKSADNCPIAQLYLGKCYTRGFGTEINANLAFNWKKKAAENEIIYAQLELGYLYKT
ncbi:11488_t:CDS:1, partial [Funneliformis geosporum]